MMSELPTALSAALEAALNRYLSLDPRAAQRMGAMQGRVIGVAVEQLGLRIYLLPGADGVQVLGRSEQAADTVLHASPWALWQLARGDEAAPMMLRQEIRIEGDTQLGQQFRTVLEDLDIDWEEHLSRVLGDVLAHQIGRGFRAGRRWSADTARTLEQDLSEYLQEELRVLPAEPEVQAFMDDVDRMRADVDRLEARLRRLQTWLAPTELSSDTPQR